MMNTLRTIVLMGILTALIVAVGGLIGGKSGMMLAFGFAVVTNLANYWFSDKIALAMAGARPISQEEAPELYEIVERISKRAGIPSPPIYLAPTESPNAFATGRDPQHSAIAVTAGILRILSLKELEGVLAHELAHVKNRDVLITTMAAVMGSVVTMIAHWGMYLGGYRDERDQPVNPIFAILLVILAPIAAALIQFAISRTREYEADHTGAELCGHPEELASALARLEDGVRQIPNMQANPAMSSLYIVQPKPVDWIVRLMSTHPPIEDRIRRLEEMSVQGGRHR